MTGYDSAMAFQASWALRPESREECAQRIWTFMNLMSENLPGEGIWQRGTREIDVSTPASVSKLLKQNMADEPRKPIPQLGWSGSFRLQNPAWALQFLARCGAWALGNNVDGYLRGAEALGPAPSRSIALAAFKSFEPRWASVYSMEIARRRAQLKLPFPMIDWIVLISNTIITSDELPPVHELTHVDGATLIVLKDRPLDVNNHEDMALLEKVEKVVHERMPKPERPTHPEHRSAQ